MSTIAERKGIPFLDLVTPHLELEAELMEAIGGILRSGRFIGGPAVEGFEHDWAQYCGVGHCIGVSSGTDALRFALIAAGIGAGDGVITVANTFAATVEAILQAKATPHFVDINYDTFNMSVDALRTYLETQCDRSDKTGLAIHRLSGRPMKAILPVHLYGQMCDMHPILTIAEEYRMLVIEDACQAHGAEYYSQKTQRWHKAGSMGKAAAFSFYPGKNLGACGEAGAVTTTDATLAERVRMLRDHGQNKKYHHLIEGYNGRLDAIQAAILRIKLDYLEEGNSKRREAARIYNRLFESVDSVIVPTERVDRSRSVYHLYVLRVRQRDKLQRYLTANGVDTGLHYPVPLHLQEAYSSLGDGRTDLTQSEQAGNEILSLPIFPEIEQAQQEQVLQSVREFYSAS